MCQTPQPAKYPISYINVLSGQVSDSYSVHSRHGLIDYVPVAGGLSPLFFRSLFPPEPTSSFLSAIGSGLTLQCNQDKVQGMRVTESNSKVYRSSIDLSQLSLCARRCPRQQRFRGIFRGRRFPGAGTSASGRLLESSRLSSLGQKVSTLVLNKAHVTFPR